MQGGAGNRNYREREEGMCIMGKSTQTMRASQKRKLEGKEAWRKMIEMAKEGIRWIGERLRR